MTPEFKHALQSLAKAAIEEVKPAVRTAVRKKIRNGSKVFETVQVMQSAVGGADVALHYAKNFIADIFSEGKK